MGFNYEILCLIVIILNKVFNELAECHNLCFTNILNNKKVLIPTYQIINISIQSKVQ